MGELRGPRWLSAGAGATVLLALGLSAVWISRKMMDVQDGVVLTSLIVLPALVYVVLRGNLAELKGPGGWTATFVRVASATVGAGGERLDTFEDVEVIQKTTLADLTRRMSLLDRDQPVIMTLTLAHVYAAGDIAEYLDTLAQMPRFRLVVLLKADATFVGCVTPAVLRGIVRDQVRGEHFVRAIGQGDVDGLELHPGVLKEVVRPHTTNAEALEAMTVHDLSAIAIIDSRRRLRGVVEREQLVSKLVLSLTAVNRIA